MIIPLSKAVLCANCDCISDSTGACQSCDSVAVLSLANVLNREQVLAKDSEITSLIAMVDKAILASVGGQTR